MIKIKIFIITQKTGPTEAENSGMTIKVSVSGLNFEAPFENIKH